MAEFNNTPPNSLPPDYSNNSRGYTNDVYSKLFAGIGDIAVGAAQTLDIYRTNQIKNAVHEGVDQLNKDFGVDAATETKGANPPLATGTQANPPPPELTDARKRLALLKQAHDQGKLEMSDYWARANALVKGLRTRWPTYRDEIDTMISNEVGGNPANQLRNSMFQEWKTEQAKASAAADKWEQFKATNGKYMPAGWEKMDQATIRHAVIERKRAEGEIEFAKEKLALNEKRDEAFTDNVAEVATKDVDTYVKRTISDIAGTTGAGADLMKKVKDINSSGTPATPAQTAELRTAYARLVAEVENGIDQRLNSPWEEGGTDTYTSYLLGKKGGADRLKAIKEEGRSRLEWIGKQLFDQNYGLVNGAAAESKAIGDDAVNRLLKSNPTWAVTEGVRRIGGEQALNTILMLDQSNPNGLYGNQVKAINDTLLAIRNNTMTNAIGNPNQTLSKTTQDMAAAGIKDPKAYDQVIQDHVSLVTNPDTPVALVAQTAKQMFGVDGLNLIDPKNMPKEEDRFKVYQTLTSEAVTKRLKALGDQQVWTAYKNWAANAGLQFLNTRAMNAQSGIEYRKFLDIKYDPVTNQFSAKDTYDPKSGWGPGNLLPGLPTPGKFRDILEHSITGDAQKAVNEINTVIRHLGPILKADGEDIPTNVKAMFDRVGINPKAEKKPGDLYRLNEIIGSVVDKAVENLKKDPLTGK